MYTPVFSTKQGELVVFLGRKYYNHSWLEAYIVGESEVEDEYGYRFMCSVVDTSKASLVYYLAPEVVVIG